MKGLHNSMVDQVKGVLGWLRAAFDTAAKTLGRMLEEFAKSFEAGVKRFALGGWSGVRLVVTRSVMLI